MSSKMEIERKFLVNIPEKDKLDIVRILEITQIYLVDGKNGSQRRIRKTVCGNDIFMTFTEKIFISPLVRDEKEYDITKSEYDSLIKEAKNNTVVEKTRIEFRYKKQIFEMDIYPFSNEFAILELELENVEQEIFFPEFLNVIKDVSDDKRYSNACLADMGSFPEI